MSEKIWETLTSRADLPCTPDAYFLPSGGTAPHGDCGRQYRRFQLREKGVMAHGGRLHAIYAKDASRMGIGFISPVQLFPAERVQILLADPGPIEVEVRRCKRLRSNCYECGGIFADGLAAGAVYKQLVQRLGTIA